MPKPYTPNDKWSRKAAAEGFRARSVYKLEELDRRFRFFDAGMTVLDLGAAPGSWLQYAARAVGPTGRAVGFDITEIAPVAENVATYVTDITDSSAVEAILALEDIKKADLFLSDIAPNTTGIKDVDQYRSQELARASLHIAWKYLKPGGKAVVKVFRGADFDEFLRDTQARWGTVRLTTVAASRDRSREVYIVATKSGKWTTESGQ